jgi:hypothetical protein
MKSKFNQYYSHSGQTDTKSVAQILEELKGGNMKLKYVPTDRYSYASTIINEIEEKAGHSKGQRGIYSI